MMALKEEDMTSSVKFQTARTSGSLHILLHGCYGVLDNKHGTRAVSLPLEIKSSLFTDASERMTLSSKQTYR